MTEVEWGDPPIGQKRIGELKAFVEALRSRPGEWAKYPHPMANGRSGPSNRKAYPGTQWTSRRREDGTVDMYGRWVGES